MEKTTDVEDVKVDEVQETEPTEPIETEKVDDVSEHEKEIEQLKKQLAEQEQLIKEQNIKAELIEHKIPEELHDLFKGVENSDGIKTLGEYIKALKNEIETSKKVGYEPKTSIQEEKVNSVTDSIKNKLFG